MQRFGVHVSISGGVDQAPKRAQQLGCDTFQIFVSNPRSWAAPEITDQQVELFKEEVSNRSLAPVIVHTTYLPNLANPESQAQRKAIEHTKLQYLAAGQLGASYIILHPGSHKKVGLDKGISQLSSALREITHEIPNGPMWLLENTAGGGSTIGKTTQELSAIFSGCDLGAEKIGVCFDTCHAFASGIDLRNKTAFPRFCRELEAGMYPGAVKLIHLNDSLFGLDSGKDRHQHIGLGNIGEIGMRNILKSKYARNLPIILETPVNAERNDIANLQAARDLAE